jgi:transcriptional regulator with XRE-family HTH domain
MEKLRAKISPEDKILMEESYALADRIYFLLEKHKISQRELAKKLSKNESEISKWLSGTHNFTFETLTKIGIAIGERVFTIPKKSEVDIQQIHHFENVLKSFITRAFKQARLEKSSHYKKFTHPGLSELQINSLGVVVNIKHDSVQNTEFVPALLDPKYFKNIEMSALN